MEGFVCREVGTQVMEEEKSQPKHAEVTQGIIAGIHLISLGIDEHQE